MKELKRFIKHWKPSKTFAYLYSVEAIFIFLLTATLNLWVNLHYKIFEFYYGQGYYSQTSRNIVVPVGALSIEITNFMGVKRGIDFDVN